MMALSTIFTLILLPLLSYAHMQMSWPYPINSPLDPQVPEASKDYDYTSPLLASGADFPCKGFQTQTPIRTTATYQAGQQYNMSIVGGAQHGGGSCQLSLSYNNGQNFKVIKSMIGGCPITLTYDFTIPDFAPSGTVLLAWTWFNLIGNREMYMDCAWVDVVGTSPGRHRRAQYKRQQSMDSLPDIFVANVNQPNQCASIEGEDVIFPNPGNAVVHGTDSISHSQTGDGFTCRGSQSTSDTSSPGVFAAGASSSSTSISISRTTTSSSTSSTASTTSMTLSLTTTTTASMNASSTSTTPFSNSTTIIPSTTSASNSTATPSHVTTIMTSHTTTVQPTASASGSPTTSSSSVPSITALPSTCTPGAFACNSATTFSMCDGQGDGYIYMGSVAAGTTCQNGNISRINGGPCAPNGSVSCDSTGHVFFECDSGGLIDMGSTAAGTICVNGKFVAG